MIDSTTNARQESDEGSERRNKINDKSLIEEKVVELEKAQQSEDVEGFISLFDPEAVWVTARGKRLTGRDEIHDFTKKVLPGAMKDSTARYEVVHIFFVRDDVAVVNVRQTPTTHDGEPLDDAPQGSPVYVIRRRAEHADKGSVSSL